MTYASIIDIQDNFRNLPITANSDINTDRVNRFLSDEGGFIDSHLVSVYVLPITGVASLKLLKSIEAAFVVAKIASIIDLKQSTSSIGMKQEFNKRQYAEIHMQYLKDLQRQIITLPDAVLLNSKYGVSSYTEENNILPEFDKNLSQW